jgi:hypothetical protein
MSIQRAQWPRGLSRGPIVCRSMAGTVDSNTAWVTDVCLACCVLSDIGLFEGLITLSEESYRMWCILG